MSTKKHRFPMLISRLGQLGLVPFGVAGRRAFVDVGDAEVHISFGPMFDERIPMSKIAGAAPASWPRWAGVGPRTNFRGAIGLVGAYTNAVVLKLKSPLRMHLFVAPVDGQRLYLSMEDPEGFIEALREARERPAAHAKAA